MPKRVIIELTEIERETLAAFIKKGRDWREHECAMTIQWLSEGIPVSEIALQGVIQKPSGSAAANGKNTVFPVYKIDHAVERRVS